MLKLRREEAPVPAGVARRGDHRPVNAPATGALREALEGKR